MKKIVGLFNALTSSTNDKIENLIESIEGSDNRDALRRSIACQMHTVVMPAFFEAFESPDDFFEKPNRAADYLKLLSRVSSEFFSKKNVEGAMACDLQFLTLTLLREGKTHAFNLYSAYIMHIQTEHKGYIDQVLSEIEANNHRGGV
jgi:hypothetical protein